MSLRLLTAAIVLFVAPLAARAAEPENPYKKVSKGEWASYKFSAKIFGQDVEGTAKQTVTDKDEKSVTIEVTASIAGMDQPARKVTIDLTKPFNPLAATGIPGADKAKFEKKESGKETIEVGGKKYESEWTTYKITINVMDMNIEGETKVWLTKDAPFNGIIKNVSKMKIMDMDVESTSALDKSGKN